MLQFQFVGLVARLVIIFVQRTGRKTVPNHTPIDKRRVVAGAVQHAAELWMLENFDTHAPVLVQLGVGGEVGGDGGIGFFREPGELVFSEQGDVRLHAPAA